MKSRLFKTFPVTTVFIEAGLLIALPAMGQNAAKRPVAVKKWTPPRTPWGDPDLQGWFSNRNEDATPLERPDQIQRPEAGRRH